MGKLKTPRPTALETLLERAQLAAAPGLEGLLEEAGRIHALRHRSGNSGSARVTRTSLLFAALSRNDELAEAIGSRELVGALRWNLGLEGEDWSSLAPAEGFSSESGLREGLMAYRERWPRRPIDELGLAFAALASPGSALAKRLAALGLEPTTAREAVAGLIHRRESGSSVRPPAEGDFAHAVLNREQQQGAPRGAALPWYHADSPQEGRDVLGIDSDCEAFAKLISSRNLGPPLAVGLFGDWGSGKSYFIQQLKERVRRKAILASEHPGSAYLGRIVQIEFNAWHYAEASLWASLVDHIFRNLRLRPDESEKLVEARAQRLLEQLDTALAAKTRAERDLRAAEWELAQAGQLREDKNTELEAARAQVGTLRARDVWAAIRDDHEVEEALRKLRESLANAGLGGLVGQKQDIQAVLALMGDVRLRGRMLWLRVIGPPEGQRALALALALLAGVSIAGWLLTLATRELESADVRALVNGLGQLVLLLGGAWTWLSTRLSKARGMFEAIDTATHSLRERAAQRVGEHEAALTAAEDTLKTAQLALSQARATVAARKANVAQKQQDLADLTAGRRLARFLDERVASDDYRKHLGVLALARRDFDELDRLMRATDPGGLQRLLPDDRVERIVLYIDDLDRCPPQRVVEVLQAVHLLLALRLFVVVVAVDARWVRNSLQARHREMFERQQAFGATQEDVRQRLAATSPDPDHVATPLDYLEKIFQIPYWLPRMNGDMARSLIDQVAANPRSRPAPGHSLSSSTGPSPIAPPAGPDDPVPPPIVSPMPWPAQAHAAPSPSQVGREPAAPAEDLNPPELELSAWEIRWMKALGDLICRSPRAVKRFVNVYQVVRGALQGAELERFVGSPEAPGEGAAALLLLAASVADAGAAEKLFDSIERAEAADAVPEMESLTSSASPTRDWPELRDALDEFRKLAGEEGFSALQRQVPRVRRFSFGIGSTQGL
ncbi:MAG: hypothetical protein KJ067_14110 [Vicinamibacteria bacterium]|nr:hypothetical protein [Vicinamibacteria bacterium]